jgi:hypothetical protein
MYAKDPRWFLNWLPATHIFKIAVCEYSGLWNGSNKYLLTGATRALEAGNAALLNHKLPGLEFWSQLQYSTLWTQVFSCPFESGIEELFLLCIFRDD